MSERLLAPRGGELLDVVDEQGEPTGVILEKQTIHEQGLRHRDVHVWITNGRDVLEQQRRHDKAIMPGEWDISAAGHVGAGASYLETAVRETEEELGLRIEPERFTRAGLFASSVAIRGWKHPHTVVGDNFVVVTPSLSLESLQLQEEEVEDARWYPLDKLEADIARPETARLHAPQPRELWELGIAAIRRVVAASS